jgi:hypothetical protein
MSHSQNALASVDELLDLRRELVEDILPLTPMPCSDMSQTASGR